MSSQYKQTHLFGLGALALGIRWLQEFLILVNILLLMTGSAIAIVNMFGHNMLSDLSQWFDFTWASSQGVTIELLFFVSFARAAMSARQGRYGAMFGWLLVGLILAVPSFQANLIYSITQTQGITVAQALAQVGWQPMQWLVVRGLVILFIGAVDAWVSYAPEEHKKSVEEQVAEMEAKATLSKASAKLNQARLSAWAKAAKGTVHAALSDEDEEEDDPTPEPPTSDAENIIPIADSGKVKQKGKRKGKRVVSEDVVRERIFKLLESNPNMASNAIMKRTHCSLSTVSKYKNLYRDMHPEQYARSRKHA